MDVDVDLKYETLPSSSLVRGFSGSFFSLVGPTPMDYELDTQVDSKKKSVLMLCVCVCVCGAVDEEHKTTQEKANNCSTTQSRQGVTARLRGNTHTTQNLQTTASLTTKHRSIAIDCDWMRQRAKRS